MSDEKFDIEKEFKERLKEKGIIHFGPVAKHYLEDARGYYLPHAHHQQPHGRRPGKRSLMVGLRALAEERPDLARKIPSWNAMLGMDHQQVLDIFEKHYGQIKPAAGAGDIVRVVENKPGGGFRRDEEKANPNAKTMPAAGRQGQNLRVGDFPVARMLDNAKEKLPARLKESPATRIPGRDVKDVKPFGGKDERQLGNEAGREKGQRGRGNFPRENSVVGSPKENGPETSASVDRARNRPRPPQPKKKPGDQPKVVRNETPVSVTPEEEKKNQVWDNENGKWVSRSPAKGETAASDAAGAKDKAPEVARAPRQPRRPATEVVRAMGTKEQQPFRDFKLNDDEAKGAAEAAKKELGKEKGANRLIIAGRFLDINAHADDKSGKEINEDNARAAAEDAIKQLVDAGKSVSAADREKWIPNLMQRYNVRRNGKPNNEDEAKRAREIMHHEKVDGVHGGKLIPNGETGASENATPDSGPDAAATPQPKKPSGEFAQGTATVANEIDRAAGGNNRVKAIADLGRRVKEWRDANPNKALTKQMRLQMAQDAMMANYPEAARKKLLREKPVANQTGRRVGAENFENRWDQIVDELAAIANIKNQGRLPEDAGLNTQRQAGELRRIAPKEDGPTGQALADRIAAPGLGFSQEPKLAEEFVNAVKNGTPVGKAEELKHDANNIAIHPLLEQRLKDKDGNEFTAVIKHYDDNAAAEHAGFLLAKAMGIEHLVAAAEIGKDENVWMKKVGGLGGLHIFENGLNMNIDPRRPKTTKEELIKIMAKGYGKQGMNRADAEHAARVDMQKLLVFDHIMANSDRHLDNMLIDEENGRVRFIDHGWMGKGETSDPLRPKLRDQMHGDLRGKEQLMPEVIDMLAKIKGEQLEHVREALKNAYDARNEDLTNYLRGGIGRNGQTFIDNMKARIAFMVEHGYRRVV